MSDVGAIFDSIIAERGGRERFSPAQIEVARMQAVLLALPSPDVSSARSVIELEKLLPPPPPPPPAPTVAQLLALPPEYVAALELARLIVDAVGLGQPLPPLPAHAPASAPDCRSPRYVRVISRRAESQPEVPPTAS